MRQKIKTIWNTITTVIICLIAGSVLLLFSFRLFGLQGFTVLSGSMEPTYKTGSVIYVKETDANTLQPGTPITYRLGSNTVATHRIIEVVEENGARRYRTKGDNNDVVDATLVDPANIIGTPVFSIPYLGFILSYIKTPPGLYVTIAAGAALLLMIFLPELLFEDKSDKKVIYLREE